MSETQDTLDALRKSRDLMKQQLDYDPGNASLWGRYLDVLKEIDEREGAQRGNSSGLAELINSMGRKKA